MHVCVRTETVSASIHFSLTYLSCIYPRIWITTLPFGADISLTRASSTFLRQGFPKPSCLNSKCSNILQCHEMVNVMMFFKCLERVSADTIPTPGDNPAGMSSRLLCFCQQVWALGSQACYRILGTHFLSGVLNRK